MLTIMAGKLQSRKTMTTQRSMLARPSSRAWLLKVYLSRYVLCLRRPSDKITFLFVPTNDNVICQLS